MDILCATKKVAFSFYIYVVRPTSSTFSTDGEMLVLHLTCTNYSESNGSLSYTRWF